MRGRKHGYVEITFKNLEDRHVSTQKLGPDKRYQGKYKSLENLLQIVRVSVLQLECPYSGVSSIGLVRNGNKRLPFLGWYPYNTTTSPGYELTFLHRVFSAFFFATIHANVDLLVAALNIFLASQFDILSDNLRNLQKLGDDIALSFAACVKHHQELLK